MAVYTYIAIDFRSASMCYVIFVLQNDGCAICHRCFCKADSEYGKCIVQSLIQDNHNIA